MLRSSHHLVLHFSLSTMQALKEKAAAAKAKVSQEVHEAKAEMSRPHGSAGHGHSGGGVQAKVQEAKHAVQGRRSTSPVGHGPGHGGGMQAKVQEAKHEMQGRRSTSPVGGRSGGGLKGKMEEAKLQAKHQLHKAGA